MHINRYQDLLAFLEAHGRSLIEYGSAEHGLRPDDARRFMELLKSHGVPLLGIETWREEGGRYTLNGLEVWHSDRGGNEAVHLDALQYLASITVGPNDMFTVQFG